MRFSDGEDMSRYLNEFTNVVEKLAEVEIELKDELVSIILLSSLPKQYEHFVVAMETRDSLPLLSNLKVKLLEESERKCKQAAYPPMVEGKHRHMQCGQRTLKKGKRVTIKALKQQQAKHQVLQVWASRSLRGKLLFQLKS